jgi:nucleoside-diphosphate-sugar epimerase
MLRVVADVFFLNLSLGGALVLRFLGKIVFEGVQGQDLDRLKDIFLSFYYAGMPLLTVLGVCVFHGFGIYTRTRFYARKHKALILFQAISFSYLLFVFSIYILLRNIALIPRGVLLLSYLATLGLSGGTRLLKNLASKRYEIIERGGRSAHGMRKVLVVGGAGYIGSVFVRLLLSRGYCVRVLDAVLFGNRGVSDLLDDRRFELIEGDLRHVETVVRSVNGCDAVIHLGGLVGDPACELDSQSTREINTIATKLLVQVCRGHGVQRLLFASTCAVYGASDYLMDERSALNPVSLYAQSKADAEQILLEAKTRDFCPVVLRLGTIFGHSYRPRFDLVVNLLVAKALKDKSITIRNKNQWRPFIHVYDAARVFVLCLEANPELIHGEIFNVGAYSLNLTLGQVAERIRAELPETQIEYVETEDPRNYRVSFDKIHTYLGFSSEKTLEEGIREIKEFLEKESVEALRDDIFDNSKRLKTLSDSWLASGPDADLTRLVEVSEVQKAGVG